MQDDSGRTLSRRSFLSRTFTAGLVLAASRLPAFAQGAPAAAKFPSGMELAVDVAINSPGGFRVQRPYVAVWLENTQGNPVRTLSVWAETTGRGLRWIDELRRWYRESGGLLDTVSGPTRQPGKYSLVWDGRNDKKAVVAQGQYVLCVEAAREHGTYQLIQQPITIGAKPFSASVPGNVEISGVGLEYRKRA